MQSGSRMKQTQSLLSQHQCTERESHLELGAFYLSSGQQTLSRKHNKATSITSSTTSITFSPTVNLLHAHTSAHSPLFTQTIARLYLLMRAPRQRWMNSILISVQFYLRGKMAAARTELNFFFINECSHRTAGKGENGTLRYLQVEVTWTVVQCRHFCPFTRVRMCV